MGTTARAQWIARIAALGLAASAVQASDIAVSVDQVSDRRTTGDHFKGLHVDLLIQGYDLEQALGVLPPRMDKAESDFGRSLTKEAMVNAKLFRFESTGGKSEHTIQLKLKNPRRQAQTVTLAGTVPVVTSSEHPDAKLAVADFLGKAGEPLTAPVLAKRGIEVTYFTKRQFEARQERAKAARQQARERNEDPARAVAEEMGEFLAVALGGMFGMSRAHDLNLIIVDPDNEILRIAVHGADGEPIEKTGKFASRLPEQGLRAGIDFNSPLPEDGRLVLLFEHDSTLVEVPFEETVNLP